MKQIIFATKNKNKLRETQLLLAPLGYQIVSFLRLKKLQDMTVEIHQDSKIEEIIEHKLKQMATYTKRPLIVDDFSFHIQKLNGFPGPYVKYSLKTLGLLGMYQIGKGKKAIMRSSIGYSNGKGKHQIFTGEIEGKIAKKLPAGIIADRNAPLNSIFIPIGESETLQEIFIREPNFENHRRKALKKFVIFLKNAQRGK